SPAALLGVTVLTSMTEDDWRPLGVKTDLKQMVKNLACLGREWGLDGVVCSPEEAGFLRNLCPSPFLLVCPGIRWSAATDDQKRVASPGLAAAQGADFLVVGRPVYQAPDPVRIVTEILKEIQRGEKGLA
ncbi:MAG TPA: orotidine 5'-phosphate decarboxylase, partial [bacterium]|nr:orotidine 5'-phosphate decarboxylase [bacterium]